MAQLVQNLPAVLKTWVRYLGEKIPWRRERLPAQVFWPREFHGLYSPWGCRVGHDWATSIFTFMANKWQSTYFGKQAFLIPESVFLPKFYSEYCCTQYLSEPTSTRISCYCCINIPSQGKHFLFFPSARLTKGLPMTAPSLPHMILSSKLKWEFPCFPSGRDFLFGIWGRRYLGSTDHTFLVLVPLKHLKLFQFTSVQSCPTLCDCMNYSTPGLRVHHEL